MANVLQRMTEVAGLEPDIICLPELVNSIWVEEGNSRSMAELAENEDVPGPWTSRFAEFAQQQACYVICPLVTKKGGRYYNSSLLLDRQGQISGVYHKMHPTKTELLPNGAYKGAGVTPGALQQPVLQTDFGRVGMQICYDANWFDGWQNYKEQGAEIIFLSSAFPGGRMLNFHALRNQCLVVSSTGNDARIIDTSGRDLASSSTFVRYAWTNVNLEKENVNTWPARDALPDLFVRYGDRLAIQVHDHTGIITIESLDPGLTVKDVLREFNIPTVNEHLQDSQAVQDQFRL